METIETNICRLARPLLKQVAVGEELPDCKDRHLLVLLLGHWGTALIREVYPEFRLILDGVVHEIVLKSAENGVLIAGGSSTLPGHGSKESLAIPVHFHFRISPLMDEITWLLCQMGERQYGKLLQKDYTNKRGYQVAQRAIGSEIHGHTPIQLAYSIECGKKYEPPKTAEEYLP